MRYYLGPSFTKEIPVIQQYPLSKKKKPEPRMSCFGSQKTPLRVLLLIFIILLIVIAIVIIVTFTLKDAEKDDLDRLRTLRPTLEERIRYWNKYHLMKEETAVLTIPEKGFLMMSLIKEISRLSNLTFDNLTSSQYHMTLFHDATNDLCLPKVTCSDDVKFSPYRTLDGSCNNFNHTDWGMSDRSQKRLLRPVFDDDFGDPRSIGVGGQPLPSPRLVSNRIHHPGTNEPTDTSATVMVMAFGQFYDHDLMLTPVTKTSTGGGISCCTEEARSSKGPMEACAPIDIPEVDEYFQPNSCMNFTRSAPSVCDSCGICQREQINEQTSFIDASNVYGPSERRSNMLRQFQHGLLNVTNTTQSHHSFLLLPADSTTNMCTVFTQSQFCFFAGDKRANVVPNLSELHAMFVLLHNRIARQLAVVNPNWNDERLYQESRKILIALMQHIVYNEYLPVILGGEIMTAYDLKVSNTTYNDVYDPNVDPRISSSFATASFRFGHSSVPNKQKAMDRDYNIQESVPIENTFMKPNMTFTYTTGISRWLVNENARATNGLFSHGIRNTLFLNIHNISFDLASLNIKRGRDHGIPPYNQWRQFCGLPAITPIEFSNTGSPMGNFTASVADVFRQVYRHPDDIDLFPGAMREIHVPNAHVGSTFACLIAKEHQRLRNGDRFYYENPPKPGLPFVGFTPDQLTSIKSVRFAKIVCETMDVPMIQEYVLRPPGASGNQLAGCDQLPDVDYSLWREDMSS